MGFFDHSGESGQDLVEVPEVGLGDLFVAQWHEFVGQAGGGEGHDAAAGLAVALKAADDVAHVQHDVERALRCGDAVGVVPHLSRGLVGEKRCGDVRAVLDLAQCVAQVGTQVDADLLADGRRGGQHGRAGGDLVVHAVLGVADDDVVAVLRELVDLRAELDPVALGGSDGFGEGGRSAGDAAVESLADVPDQAEVADAGACGDLVRGTGGAGDGGGEQGFGLWRDRAQVVGEGAVVLEVVDALLALLAGFAGAAARDVGVAEHVQADFGSGPDHA